MPKVSVLMPVYNTKEEYLREAIESILNQTFIDFEFIILNDGSTNKNVEDVILSYKDKRIKYYKQQNRGVANTLNTGLKLAKGEYIARMDSDDISLTNRFDKQVNFLDAHREYSLCGSWLEIFPDKQIVKLAEMPKLLDFLRGNCIGHPSVMFRKLDFEKYNLKYNSDYKSEDYELWSRAIRTLNFYNLQEVLLKYRQSVESISSQKDVFMDSDGRIRQNILNFLTNDTNIQEQLHNVIFNQKVQPENNKIEKPLTFLQQIFSMKNSSDKRYKVITILGIKIKFKKKKKLK